MNKPLISVIVPVYKAEPYLERCINSIRNQTYTNLEIVLVDDGSPDRCGEMCDAFAAEDSRIRVVHKKNGGSSSARNVGLDVVSGNYVGFVDSDDWIEQNMYERLLELLQTHQAEIAACGIRCDSVDGKAISYFYRATQPPEEICVFNREEAVLELIHARRISNSFCDKLFHAQVLKQMRFPVGMVSEDFDLMPSCIISVNKVVFDSSPMYHYIMTTDSNTRGKFKASRFTQSNVSRKHICFYEEKFPQFSHVAQAKHVEICLEIIYDSSCASEFSEQREQLIREIKGIMNKKVFSCLMNKIKVKYILLCINPYLYKCVMDLYYRGKK